MSRCFSTCALICLFVTSGMAPADDPKDSKPEMVLEGEWTLTSLEVDGRKISPEILMDATMTVKGGKYTYKMEENDEEGTLKIDASKKPATINLDISSGKGQGKKQLGIYEIDGAMWKLCVSEAGLEKRPTEFNAKKDSKQLLFVFKKKS